MRGFQIVRQKLSLPRGDGMADSRWDFYAPNNGFGAILLQLLQGSALGNGIVTVIEQMSLFLQNLMIWLRHYINYACNDIE